MKNNNFNGQEIFEEIEIESSRIEKDDINEIISEEKKIITKSSKLDLNRFDKFIKQIRLVLSLLKDFKNKAIRIYHGDQLRLYLPLYFIL